jgi:hypothetical protein
MEATTAQHCTTACQLKYSFCKLLQTWKASNFLAAYKFGLKELGPRGVIQLKEKTPMFS